MTHFVQRRRWLCLCFVVIVGGVASGWFQAAQRTSTELPAPTIRVTTHLVLIDAVVTDKQGNPIAGLHPEDYRVGDSLELHAHSSTRTRSGRSPPRLRCRRACPCIAEGVMRTGGYDL